MEMFITLNPLSLEVSTNYPFFQRPMVDKFRLQFRMPWVHALSQSWSFAFWTSAFQRSQLLHRCFLPIVFLSQPWSSKSSLIYWSLSIDFVPPHLFSKQHWQHNTQRSLHVIGTCSVKLGKVCWYLLFLNLWRVSGILWNNQKTAW